MEPELEAKMLVRFTDADHVYYATLDRPGQIAFVEGFFNLLPVRIAQFETRLGKLCLEVEAKMMAKHVEEMLRLLQR